MRYAVVVSSPIPHDLEQNIASGIAPRRDYIELRNALDAQLLHSTYLPRRGGMVAAGMAQAWHAFKRRDSYDVIISDSEHTGIALALLFKLSGTRKRHIMISHWLTPAKKAFFFQRLHVDSHIDKVIVQNTNQQRFALNILKLPRDKVEYVMFPVDHRFWSPLGLAKKPLICSAGLEFRDYQTLMKAVDELALDTVIAAASPWSQRANTAKQTKLPANVSVGKRSYRELRELYDSAEFVVVPLFDVDFQAGSLVMCEAMAMGKALIATKTHGHADGDILRDGETGIFVPPSDPIALREAILHLHNNPTEAGRMGRNARHIIEQGLNQENFIRRIVEMTNSSNTPDSERYSLNLTL